MKAGGLRARTALILTMLLTAGAASPVAALPTGPSAGSAAPEPVTGFFVDDDGFVWSAEGARVFQLPFGRQTYGPRFSPSGDRIAMISPSDLNDIVVLDRSGATTTIEAGLPGGGGVAGLSWSADGTRLAYTADDDRGSTMVRTVAADGGTPTDVVRQTDNFAIYSGLGTTWSPDGATLAFIARDHPIGNDGAIWTVPSAGGTPVRLTPKCADGTTDCDYTRYRHPTWSADGTMIAAYVLDYRRPVGQEIDAVAETAVTVTRTGSVVQRAVLIDTPCTGSSGCTYVSSADSRPVWSTDGERLLVGENRESDARDGARVVDLATGAVSPVGRHSYEDWLDCEIGCVSWGSSTPTISLDVVTRPQVVGAGTVSPLDSGKVALRLERRVRHRRWAYVASTRATPDGQGHYRASLGRGPRVGRCRLRATYATASTTRTFGC